ncbi:hypothetical protein PPACK8108_LOCUS15187, partial [Phakopsora pachyrhizi]
MRNHKTRENYREFQGDDKISTKTNLRNQQEEKDRGKLKSIYVPRNECLAEIIEFKDEVNKDLYRIGDW